MRRGDDAVAAVEYDAGGKDLQRARVSVFGIEGADQRVGIIVAEQRGAESVVKVRKRARTSGAHLGAAEKGARGAGRFPKCLGAEVAQCLWLVAGRGRLVEFG